jgi:hypothetical protein
VIRGMVMGAAASVPQSAGTDLAVRLLLHFDGGFEDSSTYARSVTVVGNPSASDTVARFGTSGLFDGSGDALTFAASSSSDIPGTGDWTWEASVRFSAISTAVLYQHAVGTGLYPLQVLLNSSGVLQARGFDVNTGLAYDLQGPVATAGEWYVLGVRRSGGTISFWVNGSLQGSATFSGTLYGQDLPIAVGAYPSGSFSLNGRLDELRLSIGVARDLSVVPTAPF